jgi:hypothetical protein
MRLRAVARATILVAVAAMAGCTTAPVGSSPSATGTSPSIMPVTPGATPPGPSVPATGSSGFAFDPESITGYYQTLGYVCTEPHPSSQAIGFAYRSCQGTDSVGRTLIVGLVTDPEDNLADATMRVIGAVSEPILDPSAVVEPFARFLGAVLGETQGTEVLQWLAAHLGDADARTKLGELSIATYTDAPEDHSTLAVEIASPAFLQAPRPSEPGESQSAGN